MYFFVSLLRNDFYYTLTLFLCQHFFCFFSKNFLCIFCHVEFCWFFKLFEICVNISSYALYINSTIKNHKNQNYKNKFWFYNSFYLFLAGVIIIYFTSSVSSSYSIFMSYFLSFSFFIYSSKDFSISWLLSFLLISIFISSFVSTCALIILSLTASTTFKTFSLSNSSPFKISNLELNLFFSVSVIPPASMFCCLLIIPSASNI